MSTVTPPPAPGGGVPAPAGTGQAMAMVLAGLGYLAAADPAALTTAEQGECLVGLEQAGAVGTAARARLLGAFTAARGHEEDADRSPRTWLIHKTGVTDGAAAGHVGWSRRAAAHPLIIVALAAGELTESMGRVICQWSDKLPEDCRAGADEILAGAARSGMRQEDIARLAAEIYQRSLPPDGEGGQPGHGFDDRSVQAETTFDGAGVLNGNLTPECAALVITVLDALSAPAGADDLRTHAQRYHDALADAMQRLVASGLLPDRAGQATKAFVLMSLAELRAMDDSSELEQEWARRMAAQWAGHRAAASVAGSDGAAWLDGEPARGLACDAILTPVVTGDVDPAVLDDLVRLCVELARLEHQDRPAPAPQPGEPPQPSQPSQRPDARGALRLAIIGKAADLLSGPGGLASYLRTRQLGARLAGPSLPLDIGCSSTIPGWIRNAVILRARGHCEWPGGCRQPTAACQIHHIIYQANGGPTSVAGCVLLCWHHHQVVIHRWGWTLILNPDGTTTAFSPDRSKTLHSHGPP